MKSLKLLIVSAFLLFLSGFSFDWPVSGYLQNYLAVDNHGRFAVVQNSANLVLEQDLSLAAYKISSYLYQTPNTKLDFGIREAYIDIFLKKIDIRLGKQQIIWGKGDGVFITDIVSPKDLREFILPDFEEIRIGVNSLKLDFYVKDSTFEFVWAPLFTPTTMPTVGSIWYAMPDFPVSPNIITNNMYVEPHFTNGDFFLKYSLMASKIDFELMAGYCWDDNPTMHVERVMTNLPSPHVKEINIYPEYHRLLVAGGGFGKEVGPFILRGEGAFYNGKYYNSEDATLAEGIVKKNYINFLGGLDFSFLDIKTSMQYIQETILDYDKDIMNDEHSYMATMNLSRYFANDTLLLKFFVYYDIVNNSSLIRPDMTYNITDGLSIKIGGNIFTGDDGQFGQFNDNDMLYTKLKFSF